MFHGFHLYNSRRYFAAGKCSNGAACDYCHMSHDGRTMHLDKRPGPSGPCHQWSQWSPVVTSGHQCSPVVTLFCCQAAGTSEQDPQREVLGLDFALLGGSFCSSAIAKNGCLFQERRNLRPTTYTQTNTYKKNRNVSCIWTKHQSQSRTLSCRKPNHLPKLGIQAKANDNGFRSAACLGGTDSEKFAIFPQDLSCQIRSVVFPEPRNELLQLLRGFAHLASNEPIVLPELPTKMWSKLVGI